VYNPETEQIQLVAKPIKYASIEIYDEEPYPLPAANLKDWGLLEGPLYTDNNGYFEVTVKDNNDGWLENGRDIFVVCKAETAAVKVVDANNNVHSFRSVTYGDVGGVTPIPGGVLDIGTEYADSYGKGGEFNIYDTILQGYEYVTKYPLYTSPGDVPQIIAKYESDYVPPGGGTTAYQSSTSTIHISGTAADDDQWDDDILLHKYGHFIMDKLAEKPPNSSGPPKGHWWHESYPDYPNLAYSEGWAHFFSSAVRNSKYQVDSNAFGRPFLNLELPTTNAQDMYCEGTVAAILWDIYDSVDDDNNDSGGYRDRLSGGIGKIWDVFHNYMINYHHCYTITDFWYGWFNDPHGRNGTSYGDLAKMNELYFDHGVDYNLPPESFIDSISPNPAEQGQTVSFSGHGYDSDGYIGGYEWRSSINGVISNSASFSSSSFSVGKHTVYLRVKDNLGEWSTETSVYLVINADATSPDTIITGGPSGTIGYNNPTFTFTGTDNVTSTANLMYATYLQGYDSGWSAFSASTSKTYNNLPNGPYTFQVKAKDQAGNVDPTPATRSFTYNPPDTTPPDTTITGGPSGTITTNSATFTYTGSDLVTPVSSLVYATYLQGYDSGWSSFSSSTSKTYNNLPNGPYTFQVKAKDQAGNEDLSPTTRSFTVDYTAPDTTPPDTTITGGPSGTITTNSATFTFTGSDNFTPTASLVYATYLLGYDSGWSSFGSSTTKSYSNLPNGSYTFQVKAKDQAGNEDPTPATQSFTVSTQGTIVLQSPDNGEIFNSCSLVTGHQPTFSWTKNGTFTSFSILFSTSQKDFTAPITKSNIRVTKNSWSPSVNVWKKIMTSSYNNGNIRDIYWEVIGTKSDKTTVESEGRSLQIANPQTVTIQSPDN
jgi:hypothetical protein